MWLKKLNVCCRKEPMAFKDREGRTKKQTKGNPTSIRRYVAFPSRQALQVPNCLVVCPCLNEWGRVAVNLSDWPCTCFRIMTAIQPHGPSRPLPAAQTWMVDQPSFSAGRRTIFGKHLFTPLFKNLWILLYFLSATVVYQYKNPGIWYALM